MLNACLYVESHRLRRLPELLLIALFLTYIPTQSFFFSHLKNRQRLRLHSKYSAEGNTNKTPPENLIMSQNFLMTLGLLESSVKD